jgi:hypothetical protein
MTVPGSRDEALTDDIIEAAKEALWAARRAAVYRIFAPGSEPWGRFIVEAVLAAALPRIRAQASAEILAQAEQQHDLDLWAPRSALLFAARVARGGDHA